MDISITQTCSNLLAEDTGSVCAEWIYSGRYDNLQVSIPMLEAVGLIFLWIAVCFFVALLIKKFT